MVPFDWQAFWIACTYLAAFAGLAAFFGSETNGGAAVSFAVFAVALAAAFGLCCA